VSKRIPKDPRPGGAKRPAGSSRWVRDRPVGAVPKAPSGSPRTGASRAPRPRRAAKTRDRRTITLKTGQFRLWSAFCVVAFVLSLFAARLIQLQGIDENDYAAMARATGAQTVTLEAPRAAIYDRFGVKLAETVDAAKLIADPTFTHGHATEIASVLHRRFGADYLDMVAMLRRPGTRYVELARHLSPQVASGTVDQLNRLGLPGVYSAHDTLRVYPAGDVAASIVGFVKDDGTGGAGVEHALDSELAGTDGSATYQVENGQILPLASSTVVEPKEGTGVRLTLDEDLQFLAQRRLAQAVKGAAADSGVAVVMDARTSQVLALADYPTFNANQPPSNMKLWHSAGVYDAYEPGSVQKVLTFSALVDGGYVTPSTKVVVPPVLPVANDKPINDYFYHGTLHLTSAGVVALSSNIGTVRSAAAMPNRELYSYLRAFGLGTAPDIGLSGMSPGTLGDPDTWTPRTRDTIDFGQSVSVTALQMATAISAVANGGEYVAPSLIAGTQSSDGRFTPAPAPERHRVISRAAAHSVTRMMETVVGPDGTAPLGAIRGYSVAGKTGTAQRVNPTCRCYDGSKTVSFAGFAPANAPRFVVYVVIQNPRVSGAGGGGTAGPVFHDLMVSALQKYGVPPTGKREPFLPTTW